MSILAVAAMSAISCEKIASLEDNVASIDGIRFNAPVIIEEALESDDTKVCIKNYAANGRPNYAWQAGDAINIWSYDIPDTWEDAQLTDWGKFTTADDNATSATFRGNIPATPTSGYYLVFFSNCDANPVLEKHATRGRYNIKTNIPAVQDGTGIPYCFFAARPKSFNSGTKSFTFEAINDVSTANTSQTAYGCSFALRNNLTKFRIPVFSTEGKKINRIDITLSYSKGATQYLASNGSARDFTLSSQNFYPGGGGSTTVTVYKGGVALPEEILFACRGTEGNTTRGYAILNFVFTNVNGETATAEIKLKDKSVDDITANNQCKNLSPYGRMTYIGDFGAAGLSESSFK